MLWLPFSEDPLSSTSLRVGGDELDAYISAFIKKEYNLAIGDRTAEEIKLTIGSAYPKDVLEEMDIRGRDLKRRNYKTENIIHKSRVYFSSGSKKRYESERYCRQY